MILLTGIPSEAPLEMVADALTALGRTSASSTSAMSRMRRSNGVRAMRE
jgi:hypothetical protein